MTRRVPPRAPSRRQAAGSERVFQDQVLALARFYRWRVYHAPAGGKAGRVDREQRGKGFPDLVLIRPPRLIFAELKTETGKVSDAQLEWLNDLRTVAEHTRSLVDAATASELGWPIEVFVWRPDDLESIARVLVGGGVGAEAGVAFARDRRSAR